MGFTLKLAVVSTTAVICKLLFPFITDFAISDLPTIWTSLTSWLKPPYLYVVVNFIIITIAASSRLQSKLEDSPPFTTEPVKVVVPMELQPTQEPGVLFHGGYITNMKLAQDLESKFSAPQFNDDQLIHEGMKVYADGYEGTEENIVDKSVVSVSAWKPPSSAGFKRRKRAKAMPKGGRTFGVSTKPKRQETLESTWKAITEGRSTGHLRESDTWKTHRPNSEEFLIIDNDNNNNNYSKKMTKSETFDFNRRGGGSKTLQRQLSGSGDQSGRLSKEPSLEQEEFNRRVEAFINKVNENMRLQRQESLDQYMEMIKRGDQTTSC